MAQSSSAWYFGLDIEITERLRHFPITSARCKKLYDKYFKKSSLDSAEKRYDQFGEYSTQGGIGSGLKVLKVYEGMRHVLSRHIEHKSDIIFDVGPF